MENEKISIIMSVYKEEKIELKNSIESILNQSYKNFEFIIVIDNPTEKWREEFIRAYDDSRIKIYVNEINIGLPNSLNFALEKVTGSYIARMDADDISLENRLERQIKYLKSHSYDLCGCNIQCFFEDKEQQLVIYPALPENVSKLLREKNCVAHPTWLGKKEVFEKLNGYRDIFSCEDYDFLIRADKEGFKIANLQETLLKYRLSPTSISRKNPGKQELIANLLKVSYRKGKIVSLKEIDDFLNSEEYSKKIKSFDRYCGMKNIRARYRENKFPMYYIYTILLLLDVKHSISEIKRKISNQYIMKKDKKDVKENSKFFKK